MNLQSVDNKTLSQFNLLIHELLNGAIRRNTLTSWEVELILDMQDCRVRKSSRSTLLKRYQRAVQQSFAAGQPQPMKLSEFIASRRPARQATAALAFRTATVSSN